jgi:hypothetical protein
MNVGSIARTLGFGVMLASWVTAQEANRVDLDAALTCLKGGATWSFLPHGEEQAEWVVIVVGSKVRLGSSDTIYVGSLEVPKNATTQFILACANVPQLLRANKEDWNSFVEQLALEVDQKSVNVVMFKVRRPASGQEVAPQAKVPLTSKDLVRTLWQE